MRLTAAEPICIARTLGILVKPIGSTMELDSYEEDAEVVEIGWVTEVTQFSGLQTPFVAYGNESSLEYLYGDLF